MTAPFRLGHRPALDGLRAVAVTLVVVQHGGEMLWDGRPSFTGGPWLPAGFLGVDLFFVLSGFLITGLLVDERAARGRVAIGTFYGRRALRLLPALVAVLLATFAFVAVIDGALRDQVRAGGLALVYVWNWVVAFGEDRGAFGLGHIWSLAIEEQFYLVWPAVLLVALRLDGGRRRAAMVVAAAVAIASTARRWDLVAAGNIADAYLRTDCRLDGLMIGAIVALWLRGGRVPRVGSLAAPALVVVVVMARVGSLPEPWVHRWGLTAVAVCGAVLVLACVQGSPLDRPLTAAPSVFLGRWSYELYLCHYPVFAALALQAPTMEPGLRVALGIVGAVIAVALVGLVERPFQRWKRRLVPPTSAAAPGPGVPTS